MRQKNDTWDITTLPVGKKANGCKWVYRIKYNLDGTIHHYKVCLVILRNRQEEGLSNYNETFALVVKMKTVLILFKVDAAKDWKIHQVDVHNAFIH